MTKKSKNQDLKRGYLYLVVITIIVISLLAITCDGEPARPLPKKKFAKSQINKLLYRNGANSVSRQLMQLIQNDLNDPNSYRTLEIVHVDKGSFIIGEKQIYC